MPGANFPDEETVRNYVEQAFFFLRDISHNHQHHDPATDTIIMIHPKNETAAQRIYFDLFRSIIRFKRVRNVENIFSASGILSYAASFKSICTDYQGTIGALPDDYQVENLRMSLLAAKDAIELKQSQRSSGISLFLTCLFGIFSLIFSLTTLSRFASAEKRETIVPSDEIVWVTSFLAEKPVHSICIVAVLLFLPILDTAGVLNISRRAWFEDWQRVMHFLPKRIFFVISLSLGTLFVFAFIAGLWALLPSN